jgi:hypothetical protein
MSSAKRPPRSKTHPEALLPLLTPKLPQTMDRRSNTAIAAPRRG